MSFAIHKDCVFINSVLSFIISLAPIFLLLPTLSSLYLRSDQLGGFIHSSQPITIPISPLLLLLTGHLLIIHHWFYSLIKSDIYLFFFVIIASTGGDGPALYHIARSLGSAFASSGSTHWQRVKDSQSEGRKRRCLSEW